MTVVRTVANGRVPAVDDHGFFIREFIVVAGETDAENRAKCCYVRNWLSRPENNRYNKTYIVPSDWNRTPAALEYISDTCTIRDAYAFLLQVFGEQDSNDPQNMVLPENWANEHRETLFRFVNPEAFPTELSDLLQYDATA